MKMKMLFVPSDAVVIKSNMDEKLFWFDYKGVSEIRYGTIDVAGVDLV